jgi:hypothetical protein
MGREEKTAIFMTVEWIKRAPLGEPLQRGTGCVILETKYFFSAVTADSKVPCKDYPDSNSKCLYKPNLELSDLVFEIL